MLECEWQMKQLSMDHTGSEDNRSDKEAIFSHGNTLLIITVYRKRRLQSIPGEQ